MSYLSTLQERFREKRAGGDTQVPESAEAQEMMLMRARLEDQSRSLEIERSEVQQAAVAAMAAEERAKMQRDSALERLQQLSDNVHGANVAKFELDKATQHVASLNNACATLSEDLFSARTREENLMRETQLAQASCSALAAERDRLETNYHQVLVSAEQALKQTKGEAGWSPSMLQC